MSLFSFFGAIEIGLIFALVALGVYISFRLLRFPDLTVDGSFPLGGAVCAVMIVGGFNPPTPRRWRFASVAEMAAVMLPLKKEQEREAKRRANGGGSGGIREV